MSKSSRLLCLVKEHVILGIGVGVGMCLWVSECCLMKLLNERVMFEYGKVILLV